MSNSTNLDANKLFSLFKPTQIATSSSTDHDIHTLTTPAPFPLSQFTETLSQWAIDSDTIKHISPPYATFELLDDVSFDLTAGSEIESQSEFKSNGENMSGEDEEKLVRIVTRKLIPKRRVAEKANSLEQKKVEEGRKSTGGTVILERIETVKFFQLSNGYKVSFESIPTNDIHHASKQPASESGPKNRGISYSFIYRSHSNHQNPAEQHLDPDVTGTLSLELVNPLNTFSSHPPSNLMGPKSLWHKLLHKLYKWCVNAWIGYHSRPHDNLVPYDSFQKEYERLKQKYKFLPKVWKDKERTDPKKFVYEDLSIAAYLICLWRLNPNSLSLTSSSPPNSSHASQSMTPRCYNFLDLGCGNGLLTYILTKEGYSGIGIDQCKRRIWSYFIEDDSRVELVEKTLDMTTFDLLKDVGVVDWVIGNHADELIPWIPILSYPYPQTSVFLIPCCFYNINGTLNITPTSQHYSPDNFPLYLKDKKSRYVRYLEYIFWILKGCGSYSNDGKSAPDEESGPDNIAWDVEFEILRIPSTKNVALIGLRNRSNAFAGDENHKVPDNGVWKVVNQLRESGDVKVRISDREKTFLRLSKERDREKARECCRANENEC